MGQGRHVAQLGQERPEPADGQLRRADRLGIGRAGQQRILLHLGPGVGIVRQPRSDPQPSGPVGHDQQPAVLDLPDLVDPGHRADIDPLVAAPRAISTTPNSPSPSMQSDISVWYRSSKTCRGSRPNG